MTLQLIPDGDFSDSSALQSLCYITHTRKRDNDPGIFRGEPIEMEGFLDISCFAIEDAAQQLGWVPPARLKEAKDEAQKYLNMLAAASKVNENLEIQISGLRAEHQAQRTSSDSRPLAEVLAAPENKPKTTRKKKTSVGGK